MIANPFLFHQVIILPGILFGLDSLNNLLIQENEVISDIPIVVIVAKQPVMELQVLAYFFKEVCQRIRLIVLIYLLYYCETSRWGNNIKPNGMVAIVGRSIYYSSLNRWIDILS